MSQELRRCRPVPGVVDCRSLVCAEFGVVHVLTGYALPTASEMSSYCLAVHSAICGCLSLLTGSGSVQIAGATLASRRT